MKPESGNTVSILFLDIDSVLNCFRFRTNSYDSAQNEFIAPNIPLTSRCVNELQRLITAVPDLKIVWSTSWALYDKDNYNEWVNPRLYLESQEWFKRRLIGRTPRKMSSERHDEIIMWLEGNIRGHENCMPNITVRNFAVLDDIEYGMHLLGPHYFKTASESGLTTDITDAVIKFLHTDMKWISMTERS